MSDNANESKTVAPLANVGLCVQALERAIKRAPHLPGIVSLSSFSGFGKTTAACYAQNKLKAYYIECKSSWTRKSMMNALLIEMGIQPAKTVAEMVDQACKQLVLSGRPLIIDEFDYAVDKGYVEIVRDLYEGSQAAILIVGEEGLPAKLKKWERFHGRVLEWVQAVPASLADARHLAKLFAGDIEIAPELLERVHKISHGSVRRIIVNVDNIKTVAHTNNWRKVDLKSWGERPLYTGEVPARRTL